MKRCPTCQQSYDISENYCEKDGATLIFEPPPANPLPQPPPQPVSRPPGSLNVNSDQKDSSKWLYLIIGVLSAVIFSLLIAFFFWKNSQTNTTSASSSNSTPSVENRTDSNIQAKQFNTSTNFNQTSAPVNKDFSTSTVDNERNRKEITERLFNWKNTAESHDLDSYMNNYAETVNYYRKKNAGKSFVRNDKQRAFSRFGSIKIDLEIISLTPDSLGENATAIIDKEWNFQGVTSISGKVRQEIRLRKINGEWLINGEKDLEVFYINK